MKDQSTFYRIGGTSTSLYDGAPDGGTGQVLKPLSVEQWDEAMTSIAMGDSGTGQNVTIASAMANTVTKNISSVANPYYADEIPPLSVAA